jgi:beta-N-acetylglucosaminidase
LFKNLIFGVGIGISTFFLSSGIASADQIYQPPPSADVLYNWGNGSPSGFPNDNFSATFDQSRSFSAGDYFVQTLADDQVRLNADGTDLINSSDWGQIQRALWLGVSAGNHSVQTYYHENTGLAYVYSNVVPFDSWLAYYYPNKDLSGQPTATKVISPSGTLKSLHEDSGLGSPTNGIPSDNFSARYTTAKRLPAGDYVLRANVDDGVRVYVDGKLVLDRWTPGNQEDAVKLNISDQNTDNPNQKDTHWIEVQYSEATGASHIDVSLQPFSDVISQQSWTGEIYPNMNLTGTPVILGGNNSSISIPDLNFDWKDGSPARSIPIDHFSARFTKKVNLDAGTYLFQALADDGVRVWVDDQLVLDGWSDSGGNTRNGTVSVDSGLHTIKVEYYENTGNAKLSLTYKPFAKLPDSSEESVSHNWGTGIPAPGYPANYFTTTFDQSKNFAAGDYFVQTLADDQVRVNADGTDLINSKNWGKIEQALWLGVQGGNHTVKTYYQQNTGLAYVYSNIVPLDSWLAYYYPNQNLSGQPVATKVISPYGGLNSLHEDNGLGSPANGVPVDNFSARYTTAKRLPAGDYVLRANVDDGVRILVDGKAVLNRWTPGNQEDAVKLSISDRNTGDPAEDNVHWIEVQYYEATGASHIDVSLQPFSDVISKDTWTGEIYPTSDLTGTPVILGGNNSANPISDLNFDWKDGSPARTIPSDHFSARFTKKVDLDTGTYVFNGTADDKIRILVDGKVVTDNWNSPNFQPVTKNAIYVTAGEHTVVVEYREDTGNANLSLNYQKISPNNIFYHYGQDIQYNWGTGSPSPDLPANNFDGLFDQSGWYQGGDYYVQTLADDSINVNADGNTLISNNNWGQIGRALWLGVPQGNHTITSSYHENAGDAYAFSNIEHLDTWTAYYYPNTDLSGSPLASKVIAPHGSNNELFEDNGTGSPVPGVIPVDNFSARYSTAKRLPAGDYVIRARADDGVRVLVDGKIVLDRFTPGNSTEDAVKINIQDNNTTDPNARNIHWIEVQYLELGGASKVECSIQPLSDVQNTDQWVGFVYPTQNLTGDHPVVLGGVGSQTRINQLNFDWGSGSPQAIIPADHFSATFVKNAYFDGGNYQINANADDGVSVYVDGIPVISSWVDGSGSKQAYTYLSQGYHTILVNYYENTGAAHLSVDTIKVNYTRYQDIDLRLRANITAQDIIDFFNRTPGHQNSPLKADAQTYIDIQNKYGVNAQYLVAHSILETGWGTSQIYQYKHNLFGYGAYDSNPFNGAYYFPSDNDSINYEGYIVRKNYLNENGKYYHGPNLVGMNVLYASDESWADSIARIMQSIKPFDGSYYTYTPNIWMAGSTDVPPAYGNAIPVGQPTP